MEGEGPGFARMAAEKAALFCAVSWFVWKCVSRCAELWPRTPWTLVLMAGGEVLTAALVLLSSRPSRRDESPVSCALALCASFMFMFVSLDDGPSLAPAGLCAFAQSLGMVLQIWAKWSLGTSFGMLPANRGARFGGPYALVRHPMYLGYLLNHIGFLASSFSARNAAVYAVLYAMQVARALREERLLASDPAYSAYMERVRWRAIPFVF